MGKAAKQISHLILILSLNLVWTVSVFSDSYFSGNQLIICSECSDLSEPLEYIDSICCEDDFSMNDLKVRSNIYYVSSEMVSILKCNFLNGYLNKVWQPPKFS